MRHCTITGAANGIGRALALRFAAAGYAITGIDIDAEQSAQTCADLTRNGATAAFVQADLAREADIERVLARLAVGPPLDIFVNCAGINAAGRFAQSDLAAQEMLITVDLLAPLLLTTGVLHHDLLKPGGSLIFFGSLSTFSSYPGATVYAAAKDGVAAYARSLATGLARRNIHVLTVYPGPVRTAMARRASPDNSREASRMPPEYLAELVYRAVQQRRRELVPGLLNRLFAGVGHFAPGLAEWTMRKVILDPIDRAARADRR